MTEEIAKAIEQVAKTGEKAIDASSQIGGFLSKFIAGPLEQGFGIFEDKLKFSRWENQQRFIVRAQEIMKEVSLDKPTRPLPLKTCIPLFQGASLEEDEEIQDLWAKLLVNSSDERTDTELRRIFIDILERLTPSQAKILKLVYSFSFDDAQKYGILTEKFPETGKLINLENKEDPKKPSNEIIVDIASLVSLGCLYPTPTLAQGHTYDHVYPTELGKAFIDACTMHRPK